MTKKRIIKNWSEEVTMPYQLKEYDHYKLLKNYHAAYKLVEHKSQVLFDLAFELMKLADWKEGEQYPKVIEHVRFYISYSTLCSTGRLSSIGRWIHVCSLDETKRKPKYKTVVEFNPDWATADSNLKYRHAIMDVLGTIINDLGYLMVVKTKDLNDFCEWLP